MILHTKIMKLSILLITLTFIGVALSGTSYSNKIRNSLLSKLENGSRPNVVIEFVQQTQPILDRINGFKFESRGAKITSLKWELEELATSSQKSVVSILKSRDAKFESYWINNRIIAQKLSLEEVEEIASLPEVALVREEIIVRPNRSDVKVGEIIDNDVKEEDWSLERMEAPAAWNLPGGNNGTGVVVANIDTGVQGSHIAFRDNFFGSYGWYDPYYRMPRPVDEEYYGSWSMGPIVGAEGIGVAPGAKWAACRGCFRENCTEAALTSCGQWVACPTLNNGQSPNCSMAPHVCYNSWSDEEASDWYSSVIEVWHAAHVIPVFSVRTKGPTCGSIGTPAGMDNVIGVGSTNKTDGIVNSSGRGPTSDGRIKPDLVAPGDSIRVPSISASNQYFLWLSWGALGGPHAAGAVALLLAHNPNLTFNEVKSLLLENTDKDLANATMCGDIPTDVFPNNVFGNGRVNARKSLEAAINNF